MTARTLADPMFASIFNNAVVEPYDADAIKQALINHGEKIMNNEPTAIDCQTGEERTFTTLITPTPPVDSVSTTVQGVSGATYAPMDTSPQAQQQTRLDQLTTLLSETLKQLVIEINNTKAQPELADTVEQVLTQAVWFDEMVKDKLDDCLERNHDIESLVNDRVDDSVGDKVDQYFSYEFSLDDHCDINDLVQDAVDDKIDAIVEEKLEQLLEEKLKHATVTVSF